MAEDHDYLRANELLKICYESKKALIEAYEKQLSDRESKLKSQEAIIKAADAVHFSLDYIWKRALEERGACYISTMERGDIEHVLEKYNSLKEKSNGKI